tara:strand:- start:1956 stop:2357 length:402 start_codon:yes stop_codon:yes gene_type:complete
MKNTLIATILLTSSSLIWAAGQGHDHNQPATSSSHAEKTMNKDSMSSMMHKKMEKMRTQMEEIKKTDDPDKREKLIQSHQSSMHEMMKMMHDKMGNDKEKNMMMMMREQMMQNQAETEKTNKIRHDHRRSNKY